MSGVDREAEDLDAKLVQDAVRREMDRRKKLADKLGGGQQAADGEESELQKLPRPASEPPNLENEQYEVLPENEFIRVDTDPRATLSTDVDTAAYANLRRKLKAGVWPRPGMVKIEDMLNYFKYAYPQPTDEHPFSRSVSRWRSVRGTAHTGLRESRSRGARSISTGGRRATSFSSSTCRGR